MLCGADGMAVRAKGCGMFADSSGSKLICARVEIQIKKKKTERKQMA